MHLGLSQPKKIDWTTTLEYQGRRSTKEYDTFVSSFRLKGCARYIFAGLFCMSKRGHFSSKKKYFLFDFEALFVLEIIRF